MRYVLWVLGPLLFLFFVTFAVKNTDAVSVRYFLGHEWRAPLIFVLLIFFCLGAALGLLAALGTIVRKARENAALKRELKRRDDRLSEPLREPPPPDVAGL
jgi:uncharacterized integral membrane protein